MCYGMFCAYEDRMGDCTWDGGTPFPCPSQEEDEMMLNEQIRELDRYDLENGVHIQIADALIQFEADKTRLDFLQAQTKGYGRGWILRVSLHRRGMRLHETSQEGARPTVREAIDDAMVKNLEVSDEDTPNNGGYDPMTWEQHGV